LQATQEAAFSLSVLFCPNSAFPPTRKRIGIDDLKNLPLYVPEKEEQQKIADCLAAIDALITAQTQKRDALKTHKKGLVQQLFPAEGETQPQLRFPEFQDMGEWDVDTLVNVAKFRRGSFPQPYGLPEWYDDENGMPFIQVFDVSDDMKLKPITKIKISELATEQSVFIEKGTVIITIQGSIGRVAITQYDAYIDRTLLLFQEFLRPLEKIFLPTQFKSYLKLKNKKHRAALSRQLRRNLSVTLRLNYHLLQNKKKSLIASLPLMH